MVVQYQRSSSSQQQRPQQTRAVQEVKRTPLGRITAWAINKASGTALEGVVKFFLGSSIIGRLASVILVSLALGTVIDLTVGSTPALVGFSGTTGVSAGTTVLLGALAGAGAGGIGGAIIGAIWGWFIGQISDAIVAETVAEQTSNTIGPALAWIAATVAGFIAGSLVVSIFERIAKRQPKLARFVVWIFALIALGAVGYAASAVVSLVLPN